MTDKNIDKAKGRVKEAAGALTGDRRLKNEGRVDQAKGSAKDAIDRAAAALNRRRRTNP
jgi:uncharacterized protein YjbJ (UPF0337 family)